MTRISGIGSLLGSTGILLIEFTSDGLEKYGMFQICTVAIALLSYILFRYVGMNAHTKFDLAKMSQGEGKDQNIEIQHDENTLKSSYWRLTYQILSSRPFLAFVFTNFLQEYHRTYLSNFMAIFCDELVPTAMVPKWIRSFFYGTTRFLPTVSVIINQRFYQLHVSVV